MSNLLRTGTAWLADQRSKSMADDVVYCRDALSCTLPATVGQTELQSEDNQGFTTLYTSVDFLVRPLDLLLAGRCCKPEPGDKIRRVLGRLIGVYEVLPPPGKQNYRDADPFAATWRIHTKLIGTEPE